MSASRLVLLLLQLSAGALLGLWVVRSLRTRDDRRAISRRDLVLIAAAAAVFTAAIVVATAVGLQSVTAPAIIIIGLVGVTVAYLNRHGDRP